MSAFSRIMASWAFGSRAFRESSRLREGSSYSPSPDPGFLRDSERADRFGRDEAREGPVSVDPDAGSSRDSHSFAGTTGLSSSRSRSPRSIASRSGSAARSSLSKGSSRSSRPSRSGPPGGSSSTAPPMEPPPVEVCENRGFSSSGMRTACAGRGLPPVSTETLLRTHRAHRVARSATRGAASANFSAVRRPAAAPSFTSASARRSVPSTRPAERPRPAAIRTAGVPPASETSRASCAPARPPGP